MFEDGWWCLLYDEDGALAGEIEDFDPARAVEWIVEVARREGVRRG